jgi:hypothetical protein
MFSIALELAYADVYKRVRTNLPITHKPTINLSYKYN